MGDARVMIGEYEKIEPFFQEDLNVYFAGAYVFHSDKQHLLIEQCGHIIILDNDLFEEIITQKISQDLALKLIQRGFAIIKGQDYHCNKDEFPVATYYFMIDLTQKCNMRCLYCLRDDASIETISLERTKDICNYILKHCRENNINEIVIQAWGGEPLLVSEIVFFIDDFFKQNKIKVNFTIETNGTVLTPKLVQELHEHKIHIGVSIDGDKEIHNQQRLFVNGKPTYDDVLKGINTLRESYGDNFGTVSVVTGNSVAIIDRVITHFVKDLKLKHMKLNLMRISDFIDNSNLYVSEEEASKFVENMLDTVVKLLGDGYEFEEVNITTKMLNLINHQKSNLCICRGCNGGKAMVTISRDGKVYPCELSDYPEECIGSIYDERSLVDTVKSGMETHDYFAEKHIEECDSCPWKYFCRGGCTSHVKTQGLKPPDIDKLECIVNKTLYPRLVELILTRPDIVNKIVRYQVME